MVAIEHGTVREVWLAPADDPTDKHSFLIRDDAYVKRAGVYGKQVRLGEPVNVGIVSNWLQKSWQGGQAQDFWSDAEMFKSGQVDGVTQRGRLKLWPGFRQTSYTYNDLMTGWLFVNGTTGWGSDTPLWQVEMDRGLRGATSSRVSTTVLDASGVPTTTLRATITGSARAAGYLSDSGSPTEFVAVGTADGRFYVINTTSYAATQEIDHAGAIGVNSICPYGDATYYGVSGELWKRTWDPTAGATHTMVKRLPDFNVLSGFTVWDNRVWFMAYRGGGDTAIMVSDGVTVTQAFTIPGEAAPGHRLLPHYGSLYVLAYRTSSSSQYSATGEVWRYTGGALQLLYSSNPDGLAIGDFIWDMATHGKFLVWGQNGWPTIGKRPGLIYYDPEVDAIFEGPTIDQDPASSRVFTTALGSWNNTVVCSMWDDTVYDATYSGPTVALFLRTAKQRTIVDTFGGHSFALQSDSKQRSITSSVYDGEVPGDDKTWLRVKVRCKTPGATERIVVQLILDETTTVTLGTITSTSNGGGGTWPPITSTDWKEVSIEATDDNGVFGGDEAYLRSKTVQYKLTLQQTDSADPESTTTPEVDYVAIEYVLSPTARRQWNLRALCSDAQERLDGTANPLTTTTLLRDKLEELWASGSPLLYWDAGTAGGAPVGAGTLVIASEWLDNPYRVQSDDTAINSEVSLSLAEAA